jgi:hypothetical protein
MHVYRRNCVLHPSCHSYSWIMRRKAAEQRSRNSRTWAVATSVRIHWKWSAATNTTAKYTCASAELLRCDCKSIIQQHESPVWQASRKGRHWWRHFPSLAICVRQNLVTVKIQLESEILTAVGQCFLLAIGLAYSLTLKMEAVCPPKYWLNATIEN